MIFSLLFSLSAFAYPEMVRHHYVHCSSCHVNPGGGGVLNEYGRMISKELLSAWGSEKESLFLHGILNAEKGSTLRVGGDVRAVQVHREDRKIREGKFIFMQASLEPAVSVGPLTAVAALGKVNASNGVDGKITHYYLLGDLGEGLQAMGGLFEPSFGIRMPSHSLPTRNTLGLGYGKERYALELHRNSEEWHLSLSASQSPLGTAFSDRERAGALQVEKIFLDSYRVGMSVWHGNSVNQNRWLAGMHGILGFSPKWYALTETTWQTKRVKTSGGDREKGIFHFFRLGFEPRQGLHFLLQEELAKTDLSRASTFSLGAGPGVNFYPRPHFEIGLNYRKRKNLAINNEFEDYAYLQLHYYL